MRKLRALVATLGAAVAMTLFQAPAQAAHHCAYPPIDDTEGVVYMVWLTCEYGYHDPVGVALYAACWLSPTC